MGKNGLAIGGTSAEITTLLKAWSSGDEAALDRLAERVYPELRLMARRYMKTSGPGNSLLATALVHEVYLRLVDVTQVELRYFGGLTEEEIVAALKISPRTVRRDWDLAKGWLLRELGHKMVKPSPHDA